MPLPSLSQWYSVKRKRLIEFLAKKDEPLFRGNPLSDVAAARMDEIKTAVLQPYPSAGSGWIFAAPCSGQTPHLEGAWRWPRADAAARASAFGWQLLCRVYDAARVLLGEDAAGRVERGGLDMGYLSAAVAEAQVVGDFENGRLCL